MQSHYTGMPWQPGDPEPPTFEPEDFDPEDPSPVRSREREREEEQSRQVQLRAFPMDAIPEPVRSFVVEGARSFGVPVEAILFPLLGSLGSLIGNRLSLWIKRGWSQYCGFNGAILGETGDGKSPALKYGTSSIQKMQEAKFAAYLRQLKEFEDLCAEINNKPKAERAGIPFRPTLHHLLTNDTTVEKIAEMLSEIPGLLVVREELAGFFNAMNAYRNGKGSDVEHYLSMWSNAVLKVDRKTGPTVFVSCPVVSIWGTIQPDVAKSVWQQYGAAASAQNGMLERFLWFWPEFPQTFWTDEEVSEATIASVGDLFAQIDLGIPNRDRQGKDRWWTKFSHDAKALWIGWFNDNRVKVRAMSGLERGFYAKLDSHLARITLLLHVLHNPNNPRKLVDASTLRDAIDITEAIEGHFHKCLTAYSPPRTKSGLELRILRILDEVRGGEWTDRAELIHALGNVKSQTLSDAVSRLAAEGVIESRRIEGKGTKPIVQWRISSADDV